VKEWIDDKQHFPHGMQSFVARTNTKVQVQLVREAHRKAVLLKPAVLLLLLLLLG
jgi:hypothetical protein